MTDWDLMTPGIGLTSIGIVGVTISLSGIAKTFLDGMHAVSILTFFIGMIFLASGLFKDGFPMSGKAKSATMITLGFLVTFGIAGAVTVSVQVPSIFSYIGLMLIISIPAAVIAVASYRNVPYLKALAIIFISGSIVGAGTFYAFGLVTPKAFVPPEPEAPAEETPAVPEGPIVGFTILAGASSEQNPDYEPEQASVEKGSVIEWTNEDNAIHTVTSQEDDGQAFDSSFINAGETYRLETSELEEKTYAYFCTLHPFMTAEFTITPAGSAPAENETGGAAVAVSIVSGASTLGEEAFDPSVVTAEKGQSVTWTNDDNALHTVTSQEDNGETFTSEFLNAGDTYTLDTSSLAAGEYAYFCTLHPAMVGSLMITEPGTEAAPVEGTPSQSPSNATSSNSTSSENATTSEGNATASPSGAIVSTVSIVSGSSVATNAEFYSPELIETTIGSMITWTNDDFSFHTITQGSPETPAEQRIFDSSVIGEGATFSHVFEEAGAYDYYCALHPFMTGQVVVN